jgi:hypothetical protein
MTTMKIKELLGDSDKKVGMGANLHTKTFFVPNTPIRL